MDGLHLGDGGLVQRTSECLLEHRSVLGKHLLEADRVIVHLELHPDIICRDETSLLAETLDSVDDLTGKTLTLELRIHEGIKNGQDVVVSIGLQVLVLVILSKTANNDQITSNNLDASDFNLAIGNKFLDLGTGDGGKGIADLANLLLQLLTKDGPVGDNAVLNAVLVLVGRQNKIVNIEFRGNVALERLDLVQVGLVVVDDVKSLEGSLRNVNFCVGL